MKGTTAETWTTEPWDQQSKTQAEYDGSLKKTSATAPQRTRPTAGPDGRLSWFIAALCFTVNLLFSSFFRCSGLFFTSVMTTYDATRGYASLPFSMYCGFVNVSGLIAGPLILWFGVRCVAVIGGLMMAVGCMSSFFANGIYFLVGSLGVLTGIGNGLLFSCVIVAINEYFDRRRGVALGINMTGATAASFIFPKIIDSLLAEYGLHATLAMTGAVLLNVAALGVLFRKPPWEAAAMKEPFLEGSAEKHNSEAITSYSSDCIRAKAPRPSMAVTASVSPMGQKGAHICVSDIELLHQKTLTDLSHPDNASLRNATLDPGHGDNITAEEEINEARSRRGTLLSVAGSLIEEERAIAGSRRGTVISITKKGSLIGELDLRKITLLQEAVEQVSKANSAAGSCDEKAAFLARENASCPEVTSKIGRHLSMLRRVSCGSQVVASRRGTFACIEPRCQIELPSKANEPIRVIIPPQEKKSASALESAKNVLSLPCFYCHVISYFSFCFFVETFLGVAVDYAVDVGIESGSAVFVLTFFSVTDTVGRLFVPLLTDYKIVSSYSLMTLSYLAMAVIGHSMPYTRDVVSFWAAMVALGVPIGYILVAISEAVANEVSIRNLPIAYGFMAGLSAVGAFIRPVVIGFFRDSYGSYDGLFRLMGGMVSVSFLLTAVLWISDQRRRTTKRGKAEDADDVIMDPNSSAKTEKYP